MTATPAQEIRDAEELRKREHPDEPKLIEEDEADDRDETKSLLAKRINVSKPATLVVAEKAKAKGKKGAAELVKVLEKHAADLLERPRQGQERCPADRSVCGNHRQSRNDGPHIGQRLPSLAMMPCCSRAVCAAGP